MKKLLQEKANGAINNGTHHQAEDMENPIDPSELSRSTDANLSNIRDNRTYLVAEAICDAMSWIKHHGRKQPNYHYAPFDIISPKLIQILARELFGDYLCEECGAITIPDNSYAIQLVMLAAHFSLREDISIFQKNGTFDKGAIYSLLRTEDVTIFCNMLCHHCISNYETVATLRGYMQNWQSDEHGN